MEKTYILNELKKLKPAIRMNIIRIAEQFSKLKEDNDFKETILEIKKNY